VKDFSGDHILSTCRHNTVRAHFLIFGLKAGEYYIKAVDDYEPMNHEIIGSEWEVRQALGTQYAPVLPVALNYFALQFHQDSPDVADKPCDGRWRYGSAVERRGFGCPLESLRAAECGKSGVNKKRERGINATTDWESCLCQERTDNADRSLRPVGGVVRPSQKDLASVALLCGMLC
jgi:hypothetical protein